MEEVFEIADRLTVLRDGKLIGVEEIENVDRKKLINMMVGRKLEEEIPKYEVEIGEDVLKSCLQKIGCIISVFI